MTRNYANGKIYALRSRSRLDLVYIGSTTSTLSKRYTKHTSAFRRGKGECTSSRVMEVGDSYIELVEAYPCANKDELERREGQVQRSIPCVNRYIAGRTNAEWRAENPERVKEITKAWREENAEEIKEYKAVWYKAHCEEIAIKGKIYRDLKGAHIKERMETPVLCECGDTSIKGNIARHRKTKKHIDALAALDATLAQPTTVSTDVAVIDG